MTTSDSAPPAPLLDLSRLVAGIRWRRRWWVSLALVGLFLGAGVTLLLPPKPTAVVDLLVFRENDMPFAGESLVATDVALFGTTRLAAKVVDDLGISARPEAFRATYEILPLTGNLIEVTVVGTSGPDAMRRAGALARVFIRDHVDRAEAAIQAEVAAVRTQRDQAREELADVDAKIAEVTAEDADDAAATLTSLYAQRAALVDKASELSQRVADAELGSPRTAKGTQIVDGPRVLRESVRMSAAMNGGIGFVFGLAIGLALAAVATVVADRPVLRRDIAANLGASVIAQIRGRSPHGRLARRLHRGTEQRQVAATLARVLTKARPEVSLLELGCPRTAASLALSMAEGLAVDHQVVVVDDLPRRDMRRLAAKVENPIRVIDGADFDGRAPLEADGTERVIGVGSVRPGATWTDLARLGAETVLVVRAGHASTAWLHTVARQLADSGIAVLGVVVARPDSRDRSDGTLWDALHTAVRGRINAQRIVEVS